MLRRFDINSVDTDGPAPLMSLSFLSSTEERQRSSSIASLLTCSIVSASSITTRLRVAAAVPPALLLLPLKRLMSALDRLLSIGRDRSRSKTIFRPPQVALRARFCTGPRAWKPLGVRTKHGTTSPRVGNVVERISLSSSTSSNRRSSSSASSTSSTSSRRASSSVP